MNRFVGQNKTKSSLKRIKRLYHLENQESMNNDRTTALQLKEDLLAKETSLFQAQSTINELKKSLDQAREEVSIFLIM